MELDISTYDVAFAAMCLLEELEFAKEGTWPGYEEMRNQYGICEARDALISMAPVAEAVWQKAYEAGFQAPFDFEFIPLFVKHLTTASDPDKKFGLRFEVTSENIESTGTYLALVFQYAEKTRMCEQGLDEILKQGRTFLSPDRVARGY